MRPPYYEDGISQAVPYFKDIFCNRNQSHRNFHNILIWNLIKEFRIFYIAAMVIEVQEGDLMNILEITEDKIFKTLGKGRDPKYKPIDKTRLLKTFEPFDYTCLIKEKV